MKFLSLFFFLTLSLNLHAQSEEELPGLLKTELQELVENSKVVEVNLPEEQMAKVEETVTTQASAPERPVQPEQEVTPVNPAQDETPKRLSRSRNQSETMGEANATPETGQSRMRRQRAR